MVYHAATDQIHKSKQAKLGIIQLNVLGKRKINFKKKGGEVKQFFFPPLIFDEGIN